MKPSNPKYTPQRAALSQGARGFVVVGLMLGALATGALGSISILAYSPDLYSLDLCQTMEPTVAPQEQDARGSGSATG